MAALSVSALSTPEPLRRPRLFANSSLDLAELPVKGAGLAGLLNDPRSQNGQLF
jgi:hypothetical protein